MTAFTKIDHRVRIYVVTYRRPILLERALRSLIAQTHRNWIAEVLNDDPADRRVGELIAQLHDPRIHLSTPSQRRGGTGNFNYAFKPVDEPFASILEDDNWWQPDFLAAMLAAMARHPDVQVACGNERIWREETDHSWTDTKVTIWPPDAPDQLFALTALDKCGSAKICNSSFLFRTANAATWLTPAKIPIDVTEHFRERVLPHPILLVSAPLVNYAETLITYRHRGPGIWGEYQTLLIGSVFALAAPALRRLLAAELWQRARASSPWAATPLLATGFSQGTARVLWRLGTPREKIRFLAGLVRHPFAALGILRARARHPEAWAFLLQGPFADFMRNASAATPQPAKDATPATAISSS